MNPSAALAGVVVDELVRNGTREAVLAPGSRSAPLALALHAADVGGRLRLHVRIDERTAAYLALGLAKASGTVVPVVTTSGTAAANLLPAVVEASHSGVPLLALTADRPPRLRGSGANQTIDQLKLYGEAVRLFHEMGVPEARPGSVAYWRSTLCRAVAAARGDLTHDPGPVHLNLAFDEPLVPDGDTSWPEPLDGRAEGRPWTELPRVTHLDVDPYTAGPRTLVVVGDCPQGLDLAAVLLAERRGWPVLAEPVTAARGRALPGASLLLAAGELPAELLPDRVLVVGRPTLTRAVGQLLRDPAVHVDVVAASPRWSDASGTAASVARASLLAADATNAVDDDGRFLDAWTRRGRAAFDAAERFLAEEPWPTGLHVARVLSAALGRGPALLVLGSSSPVRDLDLVGGWPATAHVGVLANRGAAGIDGTVSTALGAALACQRADPSRHAYALMGDLTFLHDATGLLVGPDEPRPNLTVVVVNDDGGAIFSHLEQGAPEHAASFERVFGTPHHTDLAALCAASRTPHTLVRSDADLRAALAPRTGVSVVEVRVERQVVRDLHARLRASVRAAVSE